MEPDVERKIPRKARVGIAVLVILLGAGVAMRLLSPRETGKAIVEAAAGKKESAVDVTSIVTQINRLNRLETARMRVIHVSQLKQSYGIIPDMLAGDEMTLMAVGDVIAGIDLSRLQKGDVRLAEDGVVTIRLPDTEILVTRLDNKETRVLDRKTGALRRADLGLEGRARAYAEEGIREESLKKGVLDLARSNAELELGPMLNDMGVARVRFERSGPVEPERPR